MGIIYIIENKWMPNVVKIGITTDSVQARIDAITSYSAPLGWKVSLQMKSEKFKIIEKFLHILLSKHRIWRNREYFNIEPKRAITILKYALQLCESVENNRKNPKVPLTVFAPIDSILVFKEDDSKQCRIVDNNQVEYKGKTHLSLSNLSAILLSDQNAGGTDNFMYEGKMLKDIRNEYVKLMKKINRKQY